MSIWDWYSGFMIVYLIIVVLAACGLCLVWLLERGDGKRTEVARYAHNFVYSLLMLVLTPVYPVALFLLGTRVYHKLRADLSGV